MNELRYREKERIGKLSKFYREKLNIKWKDIEKVMSTSTYSNIEKGKVYKDSTIYDDLLCIYNVKHIQKNNFDEWIQDYLNRMHDILEWYKEDQFDSLINELNKELYPYKESMIYKEYYECILYILNYYKDSKYMTLTEIEDCLYLIEYFDFEDTIKIFLLEIIYISNNNRVTNDNVRDKAYLLMAQINHPILLYPMAFYYKYMARFETTLALFTKSYEYYYERNNKFRLAKSLMGKYIVYKNIDNVQAEKTADELLLLKKEGKLYKSIISNLNYNIGMYYYLNKKYQIAYDLFMENIQIYQEIKEWLFICAICTQLNLEIPQNIHNYDSEKNRLYIDYFIKKKSNASNSELVQFIMRIILPNKLIYEKYKQPYWNIFEEELLKITKKDKRFASSLIEFIEIEKKTCEIG